MLQKILLIGCSLFLLAAAGTSRDARRRGAVSRIAASEEFADLSLLPEGAYALSPYDNLFRHICGREGNDWRLLSAIAYHESRFNAAQRSPRGAWGLMQIMPSVARQFGVAPSRRGDPRTNILLANKLLNELDSLLNLPAGTSAEDRLSLVLAAYNSGMGHVNDARRLARAHGESGESWPVVARYLALKADSLYSEHEAVHCGAFVGAAETTAFVENVRARYAAYCRRAER